MSETERVPSPQPLTEPLTEFRADDAAAPGVVRIDCDSCEVRAVACGDCIVTVLLGAPPEGVELDPDEQRALEVLAGSGLVPPLRLVQSVQTRQPGQVG
jgi:hypothetical protein